MIRSLLVCSALALCGALSAHAQEDVALSPRLAGGEVNVIFTRLSARVEHEKGGGRGSTVDARKSLPLDRHEPAYEVRAWVWLDPRWRVEARYLGASYDGTGRVRRGFEHVATPFSFNDPVRARLDLHVVSFGARWLTLDTGSLQLGLPFGAMYTQERLDVRHRASPARGNGRIDAWSPYVGFSLDSRLGEFFGLSGEVRSFVYLGGNVKHHAYFELDLAATLTLLDGRLGLRTGPRFFVQDHHAEVSNGNDRKADLAFVGWQFGLRLDF
ncbi:MAG: hypothetical protein KIT58_05060 [Planctomycetota bacterium]|nr:hypothetical protein [Planctomycetota bacterium]